MPENEDNELEQPEGPLGDLPSGFDELLYALANTLRDKRSKGAVAALIERYAAEISVAAKRRHDGMLWSYGFTVLVMGAIGVLGWLKIITNETAGALLGAVVGASSTDASQTEVPRFARVSSAHGAARVPSGRRTGTCQVRVPAHPAMANRLRPIRGSENIREPARA